MKDGWTKTTLGNVTEAYEKADPRKQKEDDFRYIDIGCIDNQRHQIVEAKEFKGKDAPSRARRVVRTGDVLFSTVRPYLKNITRVPEEYDGDLTSTGITILRASPAVESDFLFYTVVRDEYIKEISGEMDGTLYPAVRDKDVYSSEIPLPPLNEQRRIVAKIEELTARSRNAKQALDAIPPLLERFRQSVLAAAFRGDLTKQWRQQNPNTEPASELLKRIRQERRHRWEQDYLQTQKAKGKTPKNDKWKTKYKEPEPVDTTDLPELPEGWCWTNCDDVAEVVTGSTPSTSRPDFYGGSIPFYKPTDLNAGYHLTAASQYLTALGAEKARQIPAGSVLVTCIGATIGKTGLARKAGATNQQINALVPAESVIANEWLYWWFVGPIGQYSIISNASATTLPIINKGRFSQLAVPVPPIAEQREIVRLLEERISSVDRTEHVLDSLYSRLPRLSQAILAKAFRGELVPQDPNDEPASVLLERIRTDGKTKK